MIAEIIGCTVGDLEEHLSVSEFFEWIEYLKLKHEEEKKAMKKAEVKGKQGRSGRIRPPVAQHRAPRKR